MYYQVWPYTRSIIGRASIAFGGPPVVIAAAINSPPFQRFILAFASGLTAAGVQGTLELQTLAGIGLLRSTPWVPGQSLAGFGGLPVGGAGLQVVNIEPTAGAEIFHWTVVLADVPDHLFLMGTLP